MATINTVLAQADEGNPNAYGEEVKAGWVAELDGKIAVEVMGTEVPMYGPETWDEPLLVSAPYDNLYCLYVTAMIHYLNHEYDHYNAAMSLYNEAMGEYRKWYNRTHMPLGKGSYQNL